MKLLDWPSEAKKCISELYNFCIKQHDVMALVIGSANIWLVRYVRLFSPCQSTLSDFVEAEHSLFISVYEAVARAVNPLLRMIRCRWLVVPDAQDSSDFALRFAYCIVNSSGFKTHCEALNRQTELVRDKLPGDECLADNIWPECRRHLFMCLIKGAHGVNDILKSRQTRQVQARMSTFHRHSLFLVLHSWMGR